MAIRTFKNKFGTGWVEVKDNLHNMTTEEWGSTRPIIDQLKCKFCGICYIICPTGCIGLIDDQFEVDLHYCKGCGLCSYECPAKAIGMK
jgi:pyruvate ferredoxin oxidoreductase delta subunit